MGSRLSAIRFYVLSEQPITTEFSNQKEPILPFLSEENFGILLLCLIFMINSGHFTVFFLVVISLNSLVYSGTKTTFYVDDTSYSFSVTIPACKSCFELSMLLFDQKTLRQFSYFVDSVYCSSIDSISQIVEIYFRKWFYKGSSCYKRVLFPGDSLTIDLLKFEHNMPSIPQLKKATIRYSFDSNNGGCAVRYHQRVIVNKKISFVYRKLIELQLNKFTRTLENCIAR